MNRIFTLRSYLTLALLLVSASALASGIRTSVNDVTDAAFLPVALFAVILGYLLGSRKISTRRAWGIISSLGLLVIFLEASRIREVLWQTMLQAPSFELNAIISLFIKKEAIDTSFLQTQFNKLIQGATIFFNGLIQNKDEPNLILREVLWDFPLFFLCAWSGWWSVQRNFILTALAPSLALHAFILNYTEKRTLSLQIAVFAFIFLMGIHQNWSISKKEDETSNRVLNETYATLFVVSFLLALTAGWAPVFSIQETAKKIAERQNLNETLGLEGKVAQSYTVSSSGLPREHLINSPPQNLMAVVFTASTGERPFIDEFEEDPIIPKHYWRWLTYDAYNGKAWSTTSVQSNNYFADETLFDFTGENYRILHQTIEKASPQDGRLYWTGLLIRSSQPFESTWRVQPTQEDALLNMDMLGSLTEAQEYSADSLIPELSENQLRETPQTYPKEIRDNYLSLPNTISPRVIELAEQLTSQLQNPYDKAKAIESYLRTYPYQLEVPSLPPDKEIADYFLFELQTGYCDYYATSMIVLARAVGLPARLVIGYSSGEYDRITAKYTIREVNAHSWVEIYFAGIGWVEFEPTANQPAIERPLNSSDAEISFELITMQRRSEHTYSKQGFFVEKSLLVPFVFSILAVLLICVWYLRTQGMFFAYTTIQAIYKYVYFHGKNIYKDAPTNETPTIFAEKLKAKLMRNNRFLLPAAGELNQLTVLYLKETYSPHPITKDELKQAVKIWRKLFWRLLYVRATSNLLKQKI